MERGNLRIRINKSTGVSTLRRRVNNGLRKPGTQFGFGTKDQKRRDIRVALGLVGG